METIESYWGWELLLDCGGADKDKIQDGKRIKRFTKELVKRIDMKAYGPPWVKHFATHDPTKGGFTLFQAIETSAIVAHFVDAHGWIFLNVHSCKPFDPAVVIEAVKEFFDVQTVTDKFMYRRA